MDIITYRPDTGKFNMVRCEIYIIQRVDPCRLLQTFRSYTHIPLMGIIAHERASYGILGFYFAGIPAWALSTCLSICRHHPLERLISSLQERFPGNDVLSKLVRSSFTILHSA